jgi:hypothetical protein
VNGRAASAMSNVLMSWLQKENERKVHWQGEANRLPNAPASGSTSPLNRTPGMWSYAMNGQANAKDQPDTPGSLSSLRWGWTREWVGPKATTCEGPPSDPLSGLSESEAGNAWLYPGAKSSSQSCPPVPADCMHPFPRTALLTLRAMCT